MCMEPVVADGMWLCYHFTAVDASTVLLLLPMPMLLL